MNHQNVITWIQKSSPLEIGITILLILLSILIILGIVYMITLIFSKIMWMIFQVSLILLVLYSISIILLNDETSKETIRNVNEQIGNVAGDISEWYENMQFYGWIAEKIGFGKGVGLLSHFGFNVLQSSVYNTYEGIKESFYNITSF